MSKLTKRQQEILALIESHMNSTGSPPTRAEIAKIMGFRSPNAAEDHLRALARKGVIELVPGTSRGIRVSKSFGIPVISKFSNKQQLLAEENQQGSCRLDKNFFKPGIDFFYKLSSAEYENLGLHNGDYVAIHQTHLVESGQLALIRNNNDFIIKRMTSDTLSEKPIVEGLLLGVIRPLTSNAFS